MSGLSILSKLYNSLGLAKIGVPDKSKHLLAFISIGTKYLLL